MAEAKTAARQASGNPRGAAAEERLHGIAGEKALELLRSMLFFRRFEEKAEEAYAIGKIGGFCHLHIGQEAAAAGAILPLREDDWVISAYREHTQALAKGVDPKRIMAELYGRRDGTSGGKGGSMHIFDASRCFMGGHGIVGAQVPLATGMAFAAKYRGEDRICVCFMGDAAVNQGGFHEALNMAAIWSLPVIFVVENNEYGMGTRFSRVSATTIEERACAYGIPAHAVNGQDVLETFGTFSALAEKVRGGEGPQYVDVRTYRFRGHSMSDPVSGTYRSKEEVEQHKRESDPIALLRDTLIELELLTRENLEAIDAEIKETVEEVAEFADKSPFPDESSLYRHVYAELTEHGRLFFDGRGDAPGGAGAGEEG
ncbi:MAG: pyruvate dehydrogenase (acetyl-transferring) E1 component subunit alpha [Gemmatimonadota bacterium]|jgi:pyruvate dehydrogenase E1 component alpha subunit